MEWRRELPRTGVKRRKLWLLAASAPTPLCLSPGHRLAREMQALLRRRLLTCTALVAVCTWAPLNAASAQNVVADGTIIDLNLQPGHPNFNSLRAINGGEITGTVPVIITMTGTQYGALAGGPGVPSTIGAITLNGVNVTASDPTYTVVPANGPRGLAAEGGGAVLNASNFNINLSHSGSTSAQNGTGLRAVQGGLLIANVGTNTISMAGTWNHGIVASGGDVDTNAAVVVHGGAELGQAYGAFAIGESVSLFGGSTIVLGPGSSITNHAPDHGIGLYSLNFPGGASLIDSYATVVTTGAVAGYGALAQGGGIIRLRSGSVTTTGTGERNHGLYTFDRGLIVAEAAFGEVRTSGPTSHGALAQSGVIQLNGTTIVTTGAGSDGVRAEPSGGLGGRVYPTGATDPNPVATGDVTVIVNGNVTASGQSSRGIFANASTGGNAYVETSSAVLGGWGPGAAGVHLVYGLNGFARINAGSTVGALSDLAISGTLTGVGGTTGIENAGTVTGFVQFGGGDNSFLNNGLFNLRHFAAPTGGDRNTLRVAIADLGTGPNNIFTNNGTLALPAVTGATALENAGQYLPQGNGLNAMALGGPLQGQLVGVSSFVNSGVIDLQANSVPGDVLTITGARTAGLFGSGLFTANGGSLRLDSVLDSGEPSHSDVLVVDGSSVGAGGATQILVRNAGGAGALTPGNGILVVDVPAGGSTQPGTFALGGPALAGPYEYQLYRGGVAGAAPAPDSWFLRSTFAPIEPITPNPTPPNPTPIPPEPTPVPPNPTPVPPPPAPIPNYRREVSLYSALPSMGLIYGRTMIDSLHERLGEQGLLEAPPVTEERTIWCKNPETNYRCTTTLRLPVSSAAAGSSNGVGWARIIGTHGNQNGAPGGIFGGGPNFDYDIYGLQAGLDLYRAYNSDGSRDHAGVYGAIGRIQGDVRHFNGINAGTNTIDGYSIGAYWTHFGASGWYLDGVVQGTWYDAEADSKRLFKLKRDGFGFAASLEGGYPIALGNGWIIEPQAQVIYQTLVNGSGNDGAALVRFSEVESLAGRIGARLARSWALEEGTTTSKPRMMTAWLKASLWNEFLGSPKTSFSSATGFIPFRSDLGGAWGEIKAGIDAQITKNTAIYASAGYSIGLDGRSHAYDGRVGIKFSW